MRCETRLTTLVELTRTNYLLFWSPGLSGDNLLIEQRLLRSVRKVTKVSHRRLLVLHIYVDSLVEYLKI